VLAGPVEATVLGNLLVQARSRGAFHSLAGMRAALAGAESPTRFEPRDVAAWDDAAARFARLGEPC
jgi:rhamnulokinase